MDQGKSFFLASIVIAIAIIIGFYVHGVAQRGGTAPTASAPSAPDSSTRPSSSGRREVIDFRDAPKYIGQEVTVRGRVVRVSKPRETTFINFCVDYRGCEFAAVIFQSAAARFPDAFSWEGKTVEITGRIKSYKGTAEIILDDPSQVKVID